MIKLNLQQFADTLEQMPGAVMESHAGADIHRGLHPVLGSVLIIAAFGADGAVMMPAA